MFPGSQTISRENFPLFVICVQKKYIIRTQITKDGTDTPIVANTMAAPSGHLPRFTAAITPSGTPTAREIKTPQKPTFADTGKPCAISSFTVVSCFLNEVPKSPWARFFK